MISSKVKNKELKNMF